MHLLAPTLPTALAPGACTAARLLGLCSLLLLLGLAGPLASQGAPATPAPAATDSGSVTVTFPGGVLRLVLLSPDVFHLSLNPATSPVPASPVPASPVIVTPDPAWWPEGAGATASAVNATGPVTVQTSHLKLTLAAEGDRFSLEVVERASERLLSRITAAAATPTLRAALRPGEHLYGFGDKRAALDFRGQKFKLVNVDAWASTGNDSYKNIPFYMSSAGYGLFFNNYHQIAVDGGAGAGTAAEDWLTLAAEGGPVDFYYFFGPDYQRILGAYTRLTGRPAMLPLWVLGYHQGRASYDGDQGLAVAREFRARRLPLDAIFYDDWEQEEDPQGMVAELAQKYHTRLTVGCGMPSITPDEDGYRELQQRGLLLQDQRGRTVTYFNSEVDEPSSDIDYFAPAASDYIFEHKWQPILAAGAYCGMVDFGELTYVPDQGGTFWPSRRESVQDTRNLYGLVYPLSLISRAAQWSQGREIGLFRPGFAGSQRFGWTWTADSRASYADFRAHTRALLNLANSGFSNTGYDIGGWHERGPDELYGRWFAAGVFNPFAWSHGQGEHEPYVHGPEVEQLARQALDQRYQLIPYYYSLMRAAHDSGIPILRPLMMEYPHDPEAALIDDEYLIGPSLLLAPIFETPEREVYLPAGRWLNYWNPDEVIEGPTRRRVRLGEPHQIPLFVKAGAILPKFPPGLQFIERPFELPLTLEAYVGGSGELALYEDDGTSRDYQQGQYWLIPITSESRADGFSLHFQPHTGELVNPAARAKELVVRLRGANRAVARVLWNGRELPATAVNARGEITLPYAWLLDSPTPSELRLLWNPVQSATRPAGPGSEGGRGHRH